MRFVLLIGAAAVLAAGTTVWAASDWPRPAEVPDAELAISASARTVINLMAETATAPKPEEANDHERSRPRNWEEALQDHDPDERPARQWAYIQQATDDDCISKLHATKAQFTSLPEQSKPDAHGCGIPRGLLMIRGPSGVRYSPQLRIDCSLALRLIEIEQIFVEEAERTLGDGIRTIGTRGSYNCREVVGRLRGWSGGISEHSFGNAVDVAYIDTLRGRRVTVIDHFPLIDTSEAQFLRAVVRRTWEEADMRALGPDFDVAHRDHLHIDAGSRWWRPQ